MTYEISDTRWGEFNEPPQDIHTALINTPNGKRLAVVRTKEVPATHEYGELFNLYEHVTGELGELREALVEQYHAKPLFSAIIITPPWEMRAETGGEEAVFVPAPGNSVAHFTVLRTAQGKVVSGEAHYPKRDSKTAAMQLPPQTQIRSVIELEAGRWMDDLPEDPLAIATAYDAAEYQWAIQAYAEHNPNAR